MFLIAGSHFNPVQLVHPRRAAGRIGHDCWAERARLWLSVKQTAQGTLSEMSSPACSCGCGNVCVRLFTKRKQSIEPSKTPNLSFHPCHHGSSNPHMAASCLALWRGEGGRVPGQKAEGGEPIRTGPVTNPNPQSLTGQSLLSTTHLPNCSHIEDIKQ